MGVLSFLVTIAFISPFPDGSRAPKWALLSIALPLAFLLPGLVRGYAPVDAIFLRWFRYLLAFLNLWYERFVGAGQHETRLYRRRNSVNNQ